MSDDTKTSPVVKGLTYSSKFLPNWKDITVHIEDCESLSLWFYGCYSLVSVRDWFKQLNPGFNS